MRGMAVCGWEDCYSNSVPRLLENLPGPKLGIIGPWTHAYPCRGDPGPLIGYLQEALRWWRHWLGGEATGIMDEPLYRVWITGEERPRPFVHGPCRARGRPRKRGHRRASSARRCISTRPASSSETGRRARLFRCVRPPPPARDCGRWGGYGGSCPDMAIDQRREDGLALCFDTAPLDDDLTLLGAPELDLWSPSTSRMSTSRHGSAMSIPMAPRR